MSRPNDKVVLATTVISAAAITTPRRFVSAVNTGALIAVSGESAHGVVLTVADAGEEVAVVEMGVVAVPAGAAVAAGADVQIDATGRPITLASGSKAGKALTACSNAGETILVRIPA